MVNGTSGQLFGVKITFFLKLFVYFKKKLYICNGKEKGDFYMVKHFFGANGLTSTSANHVANLAKEFCDSKQELLKSINFVTAETTAAGNKYVTQKESSKEFVLNDVPTIVKDIQEATRLIAWIREALKAKEDAAGELPTCETWYKKNTGKDFPYVPHHAPVVTEDEIIAGWDQDKYCSLFNHQTNASVVGQLIHNTGTITMARKRYNNKVANPVTVENSGRDLTVTEYTSNFTSEEVEDVFFKLQDAHREEQAKYNKLRHEIDTTIQEDQIRKDKEYDQAYAEYSSVVSQIRTQYITYISEAKKEISDLKIVIPDSLKEIYEKVKKLGKK